MMRSRLAQALACVLALLTGSVMAQPRLAERRLADVAVIDVPAHLDVEDRFKVLPAPPQHADVRDDLMQRLAFGFSSTYLWASMGSITAYRQQLVVSLMAPDASDAEYAEVPRRMAISYEQRRLLDRRAIGTGTLTTLGGVYVRGSVNEPALQFIYADRTRRLQLVWHTVRREVDLEAGAAQIARMAASFRITRDPVEWFAAMRAAPAQAAAERARRVATARAMLAREGLPQLVPGQPVLRHGVYVEWMAEPEPRYQLLVPLGRMRAAPAGAITLRPRPLPQAARAPGLVLAGHVGLREQADGEWQFSNQENSYLPLKGVGAALAARQADPGYVYFYYAVTVRVEEESDERLLSSLAWFLDTVPGVQRAWREGRLVGPGVPVGE